MNFYTFHAPRREPEPCLPAAAIVRPDPLLHDEDPTPRVVEREETVAASLADLSDARIAVEEIPEHEADRFRAAIEWGTDL